MSTPRPTGGTVPGNRWDLVADRPAREVSVSVVVTHFEQPDELDRTLQALTRQTHPRALTEVVVADDGSRRPPQVPDGCRLVRQEDRGFRAAAARNLGARAARGEVLVFLDADTTPEPDLVTRITRLPSLLPEALVVGRRRHADLAEVDTTAPIEVAGPAHELPSPAWLTQAYTASRDLLDADEGSFRHVISAVASCTAWLHELVGGFDETFTDYGGEDWDWAHRAWVQGALLAHEPAAVAWHDGPDRGARPGWAGTEGRTAAYAEAMTVAARITAPVVAPRGLLLGTGDPVVTLGPELTGEAQTITLDSLLSALPRAHVLLDAERAAPFARDPRVHTTDVPSAGPPGAWRHLHVHRAVRGPATAWRDPGDRLTGPGAPGVVEVTSPGGVALVTWSSRQAEHRAARWGRDDLFDTERLACTGLDEVPPTTTLAAHWGGWG